jgi:hypothetical protein
MKAQVFRNKSGKAIASVLQTGEDQNLVPLEAEVDNAGEVAEFEVRQRDLFDLDGLHKRMDKTGGR